MNSFFIFIFILLISFKCFSQSYNPPGVQYIEISPDFHFNEFEKPPPPPPPPPPEKKESFWATVKKSVCTSYKSEMDAEKDSKSQKNIFGRALNDGDETRLRDLVYPILCNPPVKTGTSKPAY
jgi:hypothetical protein